MGKLRHGEGSRLSDFGASRGGRRDLNISLWFQAMPFDPTLELGGGAWWGAGLNPNSELSLNTLFPRLREGRPWPT